MKPTWSFRPCHAKPQAPLCCIRHRQYSTGTRMQPHSVLQQHRGDVFLSTSSSGRCSTRPDHLLTRHHTSHNIFFFPFYKSEVRPGRDVTGAPDGVLAYCTRTAVDLSADKTVIAAFHFRPFVFRSILGHAQRLYRRHLVLAGLSYRFRACVARGVTTDTLL